MENLEKENRWMVDAWATSSKKALELEDKLVSDAWLASSKAIVETLGEYANRENMEMVAMINTINFITIYDTASVDEVQQNKDEFLSLVNNWIDFKKRVIASKQGKFQA
jgi:hypothetical protein